MIELKNDTLHVSFPDVHADARLDVDFLRTLRIPDDGKTYPLPPGLSRFPVRHVDDHAAGVPEQWLRRGGVMLPMYQSEALWVRFGAGGYPFAVKIAAGKINAVSGEDWRDGINREPQDYVVTPDQPWLDGYRVGEGVIRQFVAMPLGAGYTAEEQLTGKAEFGGLQILAYPMKAEAYERMNAQLRCEVESLDGDAVFSCGAASAEMGLAPGGRMRQQITQDRHKLEDWDLDHGSRCFVHICNSMAWRQATGSNPPSAPMTSKEYSRRGLPWFDYYSDGPEVDQQSSVLSKLKSVMQIGEEKGDVPLPENESVTPAIVVNLREGLGPAEVRDSQF